VYFHSEHGQLLRLPARWTNAKPEDAFVAVAAGRCRFRVDDLLRLADLVEQLREGSAVKQSGTGSDHV
jgi:hypothetical protein